MRLDRHLRLGALLIPAILAAGIAGVAAALPAMLALVIVAGAVWNGAFGAVPSLYQTAAVRTQTTSPELAGAWVNASSNAGVAVGAVLGGIVLGGAGPSRGRLASRGSGHPRYRDRPPRPPGLSETTRNLHLIPLLTHLPVGQAFGEQLDHRREPVGELGVDRDVGHCGAVPSSQ